MIIEVVEHELLIVSEGQDEFVFLQKLYAKIGDSANITLNQVDRCLCVGNEAPINRDALKEEIMDEVRAELKDEIYESVREEARNELNKDKQAEKTALNEHRVGLTVRL